MTWLAWLGLAVVVAAIAAVTGMQPAGARPVARTSLMSVARLVLGVIAIVCAYIAVTHIFRG